MLSYQHAYHAGNPADLHKHGVLAALIARLTAKARPLSYVETHAGRGLYDLSSAEAAKTGEAAAGISRARPAGAYGAALAAVRARHGAAAYPGSPLVAASLLRPGDRITLMELHPAEHAALGAAMHGTVAEIHRRDGFEGVLALSPPRPPAPRKGLVLVDPAYEVKTEYAATAAFTAAVLKKWPEASLLIWYPILRAARHGAMVRALEALGGIRHEVGFAARQGHGMIGSGLMLVNPPWGAEADFAQALTWAGGVLRAAQD